MIFGNTLAASTTTENERAVWLMTAICSAMHLLVDGLCVCCLYLLSCGLAVQNLMVLFIAYNVLAFLTQPLTGALADSMRRRHWLLLSAVVLLTLSVLATVAVLALTLIPGPSSTVDGGVWSMPVAAMLGLGNSLFHVWGGKQVATTTGNDARSLGMFVSTGALGLALGAVFFSWTLLCLFVLSLSMLAVTYLYTEQKAPPADPASPLRASPSVGTGWEWVILLLMVAVMLRSFAGQGFSSGAGGRNVMVLLAAVVSMAGKMSGGWIARRCGIAVSLVLMVAVAAFCFVFKGFGLPVLLAGAFAVNATMPVTLYLANAVLPGREGLAFGLLAASLIPGYLLATL